MKLTEKLLNYLPKTFDKESERFLALRIQYDGQMTWIVEDEVLSTSVAGGSGGNLSINLSDFTLSELNSFLISQSGYTVPFFNLDYASFNSVKLIDSSGSQNISNGDHLYGYQSMLWSVIESYSVELKAAADEIVDMLLQMVIKTSKLEWIDEWGSYFSVPRISSESDENYNPRIIEEVLTIRSNNRALEHLIEKQAGISVDIIDIDWSGTGAMLDTNVLPDTTNNEDVVCGPYLVTATRSFLISLGYTLFAPGIFPYGGYPYYGVSTNDNMLVCAFAVIIHTDNLNTISDLDKQVIRGIIEKSRAAGTLPLYFGSIGYLDTNTAGETSNNAGFVTGAKSGSYTQIIL